MLFLLILILGQHSSFQFFFSFLETTFQVLSLSSKKIQILFNSIKVYEIFFSKVGWTKFRMFGDCKILYRVPFYPRYPDLQDVGKVKLPNWRPRYFYVTLLIDQKGAVRWFLVKRDRVFLFSVIRYYKKNIIRELWMICLSWHVKAKSYFSWIVELDLRSALFPVKMDLPCKRICKKDFFWMFSNCVS